MTEVRTDNPNIERPALDDLRKVLTELLDNEQFDEIGAFLSELHPAEIAVLIGASGALERNIVFDLVGEENQHEVLAELEESDQERLLDRMSDEKIGDIIEQLESDDAADIVGLLDEPVRQRVLEATEAEDREEVEKLLLYDEESAGGLMALEMVTVKDTVTVQNAIEVVRKAKVTEDIDDIHYVYVVDSELHLRGRISILDLMLASPGIKVSEILDPEMITVRADLDQEEVAHIFRRYDLISAPVVDEDGRLIGRITVDDIVDVIQDEAEEDIAHLSGAGEEEVGERNLLRISRARLPWLLVAFFGELLSALVIARYEFALEQLLIIAFFIPVVIAVAGNVGIQSSTIVVRGFATGEIPVNRTFQRIAREIGVGLINGIVISSIFMGLIYLWKGELMIAFAVSLSLICVILIAAMTGAMIPFILKKLKQDPAHASGPFITMTNDVIGLAVYLILTTTILL